MPLTAPGHDRTSWKAWWLPALSAALLVGAIHLGLALSVTRGLVPSWFPHVDGSCSVSRACRQEPAIHVFRALTLPAATLLAGTWLVAARWLALRELAGPRLRRAVLALGLSGALFLVLYATFLGTEGALYRLLRRYGVYVFFGGTAVAELLVTLALTRARRAGRAPEVEPWVVQALTATMVFLLAAGPVNLAAAKVLEREATANVLEWWFAIAMGLGFALLARAWARAELRIDVDQPS